VKVNEDPQQEPKSSANSRTNVNDSQQESNANADELTKEELKAASFRGSVDGEILEGIARENRERKATKSDDADVPIYLWEEHLFDDGILGQTLADLPSMRLMMDALPVLMLMKWKKKVTSSLFSWIRRENPSLRNICQWRHVTLSSGSHTWKDGSQKDKYEWQTDGEHKWLDWIKFFKDTCPKDIDAGGDAVSRAAESTWWEWANGLRPFHWRWPPNYVETI
jgi:hypothetical protein